VTEQSFVIGLYWFFAKHPVLAVFLIVGILVLCFFLLRALWGFVKKVFRFLTGGPSTARPVGS